MIRRVFFIVALMLGLWTSISAGNVAAQDATPAGQDASCTTTSRKELKELATGWNTALDNHDLALLERIASPEIVHHAAAFDDTSDVDDLETIFDALAAAFPDASRTTNLTLVDPPFVVFQSTVTGTQTGVFQGNEPTGKTATWDTINMLRVECGQIVESWSEIDQVGRLQQLGLMPGGSSGSVADEEGAKASPVACPTEDHAEAAALLDAWWNDGWAGDYATLDAVISDDLLHHWASGPDAVGREDLRARIEMLRTGMPDLTFTHDAPVVDQDGKYAAALWQATGTQSGDFLGMPATGNSAAWNGINIFKIECGEITEVWSEMDTLGLIAQLAAGAATPTP